MKTIISIVITISMLLTFPYFASAEIDLEAMSIDELRILQDQINTAILSKGGELEITAGKYIGGIDIAEGIYELYYTNGSSGIFSVTYSDDNVLVFLDPDDHIRFHIETDCVMKLLYNANISKATKIGF